MKLSKLQLEVLGDIIAKGGTEQSSKWASNLGTLQRLRKAGLINMPSFSKSMEITPAGLDEFNKHPLV